MKCNECAAVINCKDANNPGGGCQMVAYCGGIGPRMSAAGGLRYQAQRLRNAADVYDTLANLADKYAIGSPEELALTRIELKNIY